MLKFLRGRKRTRNAVLIIFIGLLTISLVALFSASGSGAKMLGGATGSETTIAKVGNHEVTVRDLKDALTNFGQQIAQGQGRTRGQDLNTLYEMYGPQVLDGLIRQKLILYLAENMNLGASDSEVQARLRQMFNPWPGAEGYRMRLQQAGMSPVRLEDELRASIAQEHLRSFITAGVSVDPKEVEEDYRRNNTSYAVRWVDITPDSLRDKVQVIDSDLRAYFNSHKDDFKITTEQRHARYIFVDQNKAGEAIQVPDEELKQDFNAESFIKQVRVSQIVLNVPKPETNKEKSPEQQKSPDPEEAVRKKAQGITTRAQAADGKPAEDFAKLAREFSEDVMTFLEQTASLLAGPLENARLYEELSETNAELMQASRLKSQFLASMSHELRTPLNSIIGFSKVLLNRFDGELTERQETYIRSVHNSGAHLLQLINGILDFSRIEAGKLEMIPEEVDLHELIDECIESSMPLARGKQMKVEKNVPLELPPLSGDRTKIKQILLNLLSNAIKFTGQGRVLVSVVAEPDAVRVSVADTGIGIREDDLARLFEPFQQLDNPVVRSAGGTGLGLAISKKFVELHGGRIWAESRENQGSTFHFTLPLT